MAKDTIVTLDLEVIAEYTCSACGRENKLPDTAMVTGTTASILALQRAGKDRDLASLLPGGVARAGLRCRCGCGHQEPWARLSAPRLEKAQRILLWVLAGLAAAAYLLHTGDTGLTAALVVCMGLAAVGLGGITLYKALRGRSLEKQLRPLPETAVPTLRLKQ